MSVLTQSECDFQNIRRLAVMTGSSATLHNKGDKRVPKLFSGCFGARKSPSGLLVHTMDALELQDCDSKVRLSPCLSFCVLLEGSVEFSLNGIWHRFTAEENSACAFSVSAMAPTDWTRLLRKERRVSKVVVSLPSHWLSSRSQLGSSFSEQVRAFTGKHNFVEQWPFDESLVQSALNLQHISASDGNDLILEARALDFISHFFCQVSKCESDDTNKLLSSKKKQASRIQNYLETQIIVDNSFLKPDLGKLSKALGISKSSLQRNFKHEFNQTIFDYVRIRKLENARDYLKQHHASIGEAAYRAGYKHAPNFSKAFKLAFGLSPGNFQKLV